MREVWTGGDDKVGSGHGGWQHVGVAEMLVLWVGGPLPPQTWRAGWPGCILLIECTLVHYIYIYCCFDLHFVGVNPPKFIISIHMKNFKCKSICTYVGGVILYSLNHESSFYHHSLITMNYVSILKNPFIVYHFFKMVVINYQKRGR
jgi:hypothetical protein